MTNQTKSSLLGGSAFAHAPLGVHTMLRGPVVPRYPDEDPPVSDDDDPPEETVSKRVHDTLVTAHEKLKRDSRADRQELRELREKVTGLEADLEEERSKHDDTDKATALAAQKAAYDAKLVEETVKRDKQIATLTQELNDTAAETALDRALDEQRVKPELRKAAKAMLRSDVEVEFDEDHGRTVYMSDLPIDQAVKAWAESDDGKIFVLDGNSGGGAPGGGRGHVGKNPWKKGSPDFSLTEQDRLEQRDPTLAKRLKAEAGVA